MSKQEDKLRWYGFIILMCSVGLFVFLNLLPTITHQCKADAIAITVGSASYSYPSVLLLIGVALILNLGGALYQRIAGNKK